MTADALETSCYTIDKVRWKRVQSFAESALTIDTTSSKPSGANMPAFLHKGRTMASPRALLNSFRTISILLAALGSLAAAPTLIGSSRRIGADLP